MKEVIITQADWNEAINYSLRAAESGLGWDSIDEQIALLKHIRIDLTKHELPLLMAIDVQMNVRYGMSVQEHLVTELKRQKEGYLIKWDVKNFDIPGEDPI